MWTTATSRTKSPGVDARRNGRKHAGHLTHEKVFQSVHHSLTELNITPLLDLAFVLLVIFIITTIPPVKDLDLKLPTAPAIERPAAQGQLHLRPGRRHDVFEQKGSRRRGRNVADAHRPARRTDPDLNVIVRGDARPNTNKSAPCWMSASRPTCRRWIWRPNPLKIKCCRNPNRAKAQLVEGEPDHFVHVSRVARGAGVALFCGARRDCWAKN
jgi:biopolymer transport protein ExbD